MAEIVVHKLYEEKERQYIIDAYESFGKKTARKWKEELKKIQNFLKKYPEAKPPFLGAPKFSYLLRGANFMRHASSAISRWREASKKNTGNNSGGNDDSDDNNIVKQ